MLRSGVVVVYLKKSKSCVSEQDDVDLRHICGEERRRS